MCATMEDGGMKSCDYEMLSFVDIVGMAFRDMI